MGPDGRRLVLLVVLALSVAAGLPGLWSQAPLVAGEGPSPAVTAAPAPVRAPAAAPPAVRSRPVAVVQRGDGDPVVVPGGSARSGSGPLRTYTVAVEGGLGVDPRAFAAAVERTLADPRSWGAGERLSFQRTDAGRVDVRVVLASPSTTDRLCAPLRTNGIFSCGAGTTAVVNSLRWLRGAATYGGRLADYRDYVVNHEVGHALGHGHASCPARGAPAPVMVQQTKSAYGCVAQPWPFP